MCQSLRNFAPKFNLKLNMATKKRTFYAYKIVNETVSNATSKLKTDLTQKLTSHVDNFGNRCKAIVDGSTTQDVLACFVPLNNTPSSIAGEMWRIAPSKDMPSGHPQKRVRRFDIEG